MKSKDIVKQFIDLAENMTEESHKKAMSFIFRKFMTDLGDLIKARNIKHDSGLIPIFKEFNLKWISCYNLLESHYGISPIVKDGFEKILELKFPQGYILYIKNK